MDDFESAKQFFFEGLQLMEANDFLAAESKFARALELVPGRISTLNNLSAVKIKLKKFVEAEACARQAIALEAQSPEAWLNVGLAQAATDRPEEALQAYDRALQGKSASGRTWLNKAMTLLELKRYGEALLACDQALQLQPDHHQVLYSKSLILKELGRLDEAQKIYLLSLEQRVASSPVFKAERRPTQKADALIISQNPVIDDSFRSFENLHLGCLNYPSQLAERFLDDIHFTYVFEGDAADPANRKRIPQPDFVINNNANGERILSRGNLSALITLVDSFGVPVVNHPAKVIQTTREVSAKLLENIPGVMVPKTRRFSSAGKTAEALAREIEAQYDYPLITRTLAGQEGQGMTKVDSRDALLQVFASRLPVEFLVTEFVDSRGKNEFFRKIRAAIVRDQIIIVRVDYDSQWKIYARKSDASVAFYMKNTHLLDDEKRICKDPEAGLGRSTIPSLRAIRDRIPLDVFGIDFDVDAAGRLIFYEANATMNLFSTARKEVPNPKEADDALKLAFQRYFTSLAARR